MSKAKSLYGMFRKPYQIKNDGRRIRVTIIGYYPARRIVRIRWSGGLYQNCHRDLPYYTNPHGVEFFDVFGTRFYSDGMVCGKGAYNGR